MLSLPEEPRILKLRTCCRNSSRQVLRVHGFEEGAPHVEIGDHQRRVDLLAVRERDAGGAAALHENLAHRRARCGSCRRSPRSEAPSALRDRAHAAARESPGADRVVDVAHVVMQQHVGGARRARPQAPCR